MPIEQLQQNKAVFNTFKHDNAQHEKIMSDVTNHFDEIFNNLYYKDHHILKKKTPKELWLQGLTYLSQINNEYLSYLYCEISLQIEENGYNEFEKREQGGLKAWLAAFSMSLHEFDPAKEMTINTFEKLHKKTMSFQKPKEDSSYIEPGEIRDRDVYINIPSELASIAGLTNLIRFIKYKNLPESFFSAGNLQEIRKQAPLNNRNTSHEMQEDAFAIQIAGRIANGENEKDIAKDLYQVMQEEDIFYAAPALFPEEIKGKLTNDLKMLYLSLNQKNKEEKKELEKNPPDENKLKKILKDKINLINQFSINTMLLHPFLDGNNRVIINQAKNIFLMQLGLPPAIYYNPLIHFAFTTEETTELTLLAIGNTLELLKFQNNKDCRYQLSFTQNSKHEEYTASEDFQIACNNFRNKLADLITEKNNELNVKKYSELSIQWQQGSTDISTNDSDSHANHKTISLNSK